MHRLRQRAANRACPVALIALTLASGAVRAQASHEHPRRSFEAALHAIGLLTHVDPAVGGESMTEGYLTQPLIMLHGASAGRTFEALLTIDFEGLTLDRGELTPGAWGEGYIDRRHPHAYVHEAIVTMRATAAGAKFSLAAGRGFAPFGTDDPMMRPFVKYPVNHHLAQVLERSVVVVAARRGPLLLEGALFGGDEPTSPGRAPKAGRFADSWSTRLTVTLLPGLEASGSAARVESPENRSGGGLDQRKWSAAVRWSADRDRGPHYALIEWARTDESLAGPTLFTYSSLLGEVSARLHGADVSLRLERTTRPEEERTLDFFRSPRPIADFHIMGITRWEIATVAVRLSDATLGPLRMSPFAEASLAHPVQHRRPSLFIPETFYGSDRLWTLSAGIRFGLFARAHSMGRYGVAER
ncbi:MAG TPA: hypothetical protein VFG84_07490 [Gemmatimonadaceae bacterium]|nr:hypothetical protein [Gemmatimonadaceae bacterium]